MAGRVHRRTFPGIESVHAIRGWSGQRRPRPTVCSAVAAACIFASALHAGIKPVPPCRADFDFNAVVNGVDLGMLLGQWGACSSIPGPCFADLDPNGIVNGIDLGMLLGAFGPAPGIPCVHITGVQPPAGAPGTVVNITGSFLNPNHLDYCLVGMEEGNPIMLPFTVTAVSPNNMTAICGPVPPGTGRVNMMIGTGQGNEVTIAPPVGTSLGGMLWAWQADGPGLMGEAVFTPQAPGGVAGPGATGTFYGALVGGDLQVTISGTCPLGTMIRIWPRAHHYVDPTVPGDVYVGLDAFISCMEITSASSEAECATKICDAIKATYLAAGITIDCTTASVAGGTQLTLSLPGLAINAGVFNVEILTAAMGPCGCNSFSCPWDLDCDGTVGPPDLSILLSTFGPCPPAPPCIGDFDGDGFIGDSDDVSIMTMNFGPCP